MSIACLLHADNKGIEGCGQTHKHGTAALGMREEAVAVAREMRQEREGRHIRVVSQYKKGKWIWFTCTQEGGSGAGLKPKTGGRAEILESILQETRATQYRR